jgi:F420-non-reducing hydrogenase large subunit
MIMKQIEISPVTRIEGHSKITVQIDDSGNVEDAHFHVMEIRGFEKFLEGAAIEEAPRITPRICGVCQTAHHIASAKATDAVFQLHPPETANKLRELMLLGQYIHSHSLHFYFLAAPDLVLGPDADPSERNLLGVLKNSPELAQMAIKTRKAGQQITAAVGGKPVHPVTAVPGGQSTNLSPEKRDEVLEDARNAVKYIENSFEEVKPLFSKYSSEIESLGTIETYYGGITNNGDLQFYDGPMTIIDKDGNEVYKFQANEYLEYIQEKVQPWSYMKFPFLKKIGFPDGNYRVGPMARLNLANNVATSKAGEMFKEYKENFPIAHNPLLNHYARLIELMYAAERAQELLEDQAIINTEVKQPFNYELMSENEAKKSDKSMRGVGMIEAPRGTLIHDYETDGAGFITRANLIVATGQNNLSIDMGVRETAKKMIKGQDVPEGLKNRLEMIVRAYDPCLSCATHTINGSSPLLVEVYNNQGKLLKSHHIKD